MPDFFQQTVRNNHKAKHPNPRRQVPQTEAKNRTTKQNSVRNTSQDSSVTPDRKHQRSKNPLQQAINRNPNAENRRQSNEQTVRNSPPIRPQLTAIPSARQRKTQLDRNQITGATQEFLQETSRKTASARQKRSISARRSMQPTSSPNSVRVTAGTQFAAAGSATEAIIAASSKPLYPRKISFRVLLPGAPLAGVPLPTARANSPSL